METKTNKRIKPRMGDGNFGLDGWKLAVVKAILYGVIVIGIGVIAYYTYQSFQIASTCECL